MFSPLQQIPLFAFAPKSIRRSKAPPKHKEIGKRNIFFGQNTRKKAKERYCLAETQENRQKKNIVRPKHMVKEKKNFSAKTTRNGQIRQKMHFSVKIQGQTQKKISFSQNTRRWTKRKYFSETEKLKREKCNPSEYFLPEGFFFIFASKANVS